MENEELISLVWEFLAKSDVPLTAQELQNYTGQPAVKIQRVLGSLNNEKLLCLHSKSNETASYTALLELDAFRWAQAVGLGIDLALMEEFVSLPAAEKKLALRMTVDGSLEKIEEVRRQEKLEATQKLIRGRAASKAAASELAKILKDTEDALSFANSSNSVKKNKDDEEMKAIKDILTQAHAQTRKAFDGLVENLSRRA